LRQQPGNGGRLGNGRPIAAAARAAGCRQLQPPPARGHQALATAQAAGPGRSGKLTAEETAWTIMAAALPAGVLPSDLASRLELTLSAGKEAGRLTLRYFQQ